jgi:hypothetical protein
MKKITILVFFIAVIFNAHTQIKKEKSGHPDLPGTIVLELGVNRPQNAAPNFDVGLWGSRTVNLYYQYELRISKSKFSFVPGIGVGLDRYKFRNNYTMNYASTTSTLTLSKSDLAIQKSQLITNYLDAPLELRYTSNPSDPNRSLKIAFGFRAGVLISSFTKLKYPEGQGTTKLKTRKDWNLNQYRYGVYGKIGTGNFNVFGYYNISTLFKTGNGPDGYDINNLTVGISLGGF